MPKPPILQMSRLREIGWSEWDPIGLVDSGCPRDEYDEYLLQTVSRFRRGDQVSEVACYLDTIATDTMGLGRSTPEGLKAAETTATKIKAYLDTLPPGPLRVR